MRNLLADNLAVLLERDPALAGQLRGCPLTARLLAHALPPQGPTLDSDARDWVAAQLTSLLPDRLHLVLGLSHLSVALKQRAELPLWIIEPRAEVVAAMLSQTSVLPLVLNGRLVVPDSPARLVQDLARFGTLDLVRLPLAGTESKLWFAEFETLLFQRAARVRELQEKNRRERLLARVPPGSGLAQIFESCARDELLSVKAVDARLAGCGRAWTREERLFVTMECFK